MLTAISRPKVTMKSVRPKLVPTLVCLGVVALVATFLPYPGFETQVNVIDTPSSQTSHK